MSESLRERVARAMCLAAELDPDENFIGETPRWQYYLGLADAAIPLCVNECAAKVRPDGPRPCHCEWCYCGNRDDAARVAAWDEANANAQSILALGEKS